MAQATMEFVHLESTPSLETFVRYNLQKMTGKFSGIWRRATVRFIGMVSARSPNGQAKEFTAEILVDIPARKTVVVKKKNNDLKTAIHQAVAAVQKVAR